LNGESLMSDVLAPGQQAVVEWAPITMERGDGPFLYTQEGRCLIDFYGGSSVALIGHSHPDWTRAVRDQVAKLVIGAFPTEARKDGLAMLGRELGPGWKVALFSGGSESVEAALRLAQAVTSKSSFISLERGYHGRTLGSRPMSPGEEIGYGPNPENYTLVPTPVGVTSAELIAHITDQACACVYGAAGDLAAVVVETVQGRAGNRVVSPAYLAALREACANVGALFIVDETMTGLGRCGAFLSSRYLEPDAIILGKGLGGGFPVTALAYAPSLAVQGTRFGQASANSSSFGGNAVAGAAIAATMSVLERGWLVERSATLGATWMARLKAGLIDNPAVDWIDGSGMMIGIGLRGKRDSTVREEVRRTYLELAKAGLLVMVGSSSLRLYPPLNVPESVLDDAFDILSTVIG